MLYVTLVNSLILPKLEHTHNDIQVLQLASGYYAVIVNDKNDIQTFIPGN